jgi:hypothetical protein
VVDAFIAARLATAALLLAACAASPAASPTTTYQPAQTAVPSPATETAENQLSATDIANITLLNLGPESQVTSPIDLAARLTPGANDRVRIALTDQNDRLLAEHVLELQLGQDLDLKIPFEIGHPTLPARLTVSTQDEYGRIQALNSVDLTLLANGAAQLTPADARVHIAILQPAAGAQIPSSDLQISGIANGEPGRPLTIQLITRAGKVLTFGEIYPDYSADGAGEFAIEFNLDIKEATWVQVAVFENSGGFDGPAHFNSVEVLLTP